MFGLCSVAVVILIHLVWGSLSEPDHLNPLLTLGPAFVCGSAAGLTVSHFERRRQRRDST